MVAGLTEAPAPNFLGEARRVVIKVGSALLVDQSGGLKSQWLDGLIDDVADLRAQGKGVALVSSGSIALGRGMLGLPRSELTLNQSQAAAAVGQIALARAYSAALERRGLTAAQVLLTLEDTDNRRRYLNGRETLRTLMRHGAVPVANENDTVATDEIRYGDNDRLAARVALMCGADALILLSDIDGLYTANPKIDSFAQHLPLVREITPEIEAMAGDPVSSLSKGGMRTKIMAAKTATSGGCAMAVALGEAQRPIRALRGGARRTWFAPAADPTNARKQWIAAQKPQGVLVIDSGAAEALRSGASLLAAGVRSAAGEFNRGDAVRITTLEGVEIGAGLITYTLNEINLIAGRKTGDIPKLLGYSRRSATIHRDDMVVWG